MLNDQVPATGADRLRDVRADLIDSIVMVTVCLLSRCDLRSLRVGHQAGRRKRFDFVGLSRETIAGWCGLHPSTVSRVLTLLRRAGLVHGPAREEGAVNRIGQPWEPGPDGTTAWQPAIRQFNVAFFSVLGLGPELHRVRTAKPAPSPADRVASGRAQRASVDTLEQANAARLARLFPNGPPDG
jgi:DNA-binding transcriptional ArsR family regulator